MLTTEQRSPYQISADLRKSKRPPIIHETIYQHIYADKDQRETLHSHLRHRAGGGGDDSFFVGSGFGIKDASTDNDWLTVNFSVPCDLQSSGYNKDL